MISLTFFILFYSNRVTIEGSSICQLVKLTMIRATTQMIKTLGGAHIQNGFMYKSGTLK